MSGPDFDEHVPAPSYRPSGWFSALTLLPLLAIGIVVSLAMGVVLLLAEEDLYFYFMTPAIVGAPVFAAIWGVVRFSHCRNPLVGTLVGLTLATLYYVGYWELSYRLNVVSHGPVAVAMVRQIGGAPGLPGYVNFRCKTSKPVHHPGGGAAAMRPPNRVDYVFNYVFFGGEALLIAGIGVAIGRSWSQRVYYEAQRRWSSRFEFRLPPATLSAVLAAVEKHDWAAIAALPRVASLGNANTASLLFRVEYLAGVPDSPTYLTVSGTNLPKDLARQAGVPRPKRGVFLRQVALDSESSRGLAGAFPDIKLRTPSAAGNDTAAAQISSAPPAEVFDPLGGEPARRRKDATAAPRADFRDRAVAATRELLNEQDQSEPWAVDASSCLPTGLGPRQVRSAAWWKTKLLVGCFVSFFAMLVLAAWAGERKPPPGQFATVNAVLCGAGVAGAATIGVVLLWGCFGGDALQKRLLVRRLGRRPGSLLPAAGHLPTKLLRVEDAQTYHVQKLTPEDVCVCAFDAENRRVLLEGVSHRYIIRAGDVTSFWPLQSGEKASIRIDYRIGEEPLNLVVAADNPLAHLFHGVFAHRALKKLTARFVATFGRDFPAAGLSAAPPASA